MKTLKVIAAVAASFTLFACGGGGGGGSDTNSGNGNTTPPVTEVPKPGNNYPIETTPANYAESNRADIYAVVNNFRTTCGFGSIKQNSLLDTAATGHANYLQTNNTYGHVQVNTNPGFTGADLLSRGTAAGYQASMLGEIAGTRNSGSLIAGTSPSGIETSASEPTGKAMIKSLFASVYHLAAATSEWTEMGVGFSVSGNKTPLPGETMFYGATVVNFGIPAGSVAPVYTGGKVRSFPCNGMTEGVSPIFTAELPSPYPSRDFNVSPMGAPVYFTSAYGGSIVITSAEMVHVATNTPVVTKIFNSSDDVNKMLGLNQAFVIPDQPLQPNAQYKITVSGTSDAKPMNEVITFSTGTQN